MAFLYLHFTGGSGLTRMYLAALLVVGFLCNLFITAVNERHHMVPDETDAIGMAD